MQRKVGSRRHWDDRTWSVHARYRSVANARITARWLRRSGFLARVIRIKATTGQDAHPTEYLVYKSRRGKGGVRRV